jgi:ArsR family transcriptional regulator
MCRGVVVTSVWAHPNPRNSSSPAAGLLKLSQARADQLAAALKVIADPARLRLLSLIQAQPEHEACVCHLTEPLGLTQPTVSHHLKVLLQAGLVEREQRGSWAYFRVNAEPLSLLGDLLT